MGVYLADQTITFLYALLAGAAMGLLYDVFRISRIAIPTPSAVTFAEDILFFLICAAATFGLMMESLDGRVRVFLLVGQMIGAVLYFSTASKLVMMVAGTIIRIIKAILRFIFNWLLLPAWRFVYWTASLLLRPMFFFGRILKKYFQRLKFRLKIRRIVLYNHCKGFLRRKIKRKSPLGAEHAKDTPH